MFRRSTLKVVAASAPLLFTLLVAPVHGATQVTLKVSSFGNVFEPKIVDAYRKLHPNIKIVINKMDLDGEHQQLLRSLNSNAVPDIAAVELSYMGQFRQPMIASRFTDLNTLGARAISKDYLPFRYTQGTALNGSQIGIPTDVGGLAVAYRVDLFKQAGLPTDRTKVAKLWRTWADFIKVGKSYNSKMPRSKFIDSTGTLFAAVLNQGTSKYYDPRSHQLIYSNNTHVHQAFNVAAQAGCVTKAAGKCNSSIGTKINQFTADWGAGMQHGAFATILAPAWMLDYIKQQAPSTKGKWDVAAVPGGGGNMGGSMLTIPKNSGNQAASWAFIKWYLAPAQQLTTFKQYGLFPTTYNLYSNPAIKNYKDPFFNNAPLGKIYSSSALALKPIYSGAKDRIIDSTFGQALSRVTQGTQTQSCGGHPSQTVDAAWCQALNDIRRNVG